MRFGQLSLGDFTLNIAVLTSFRSSLMELFGLFGEQSASSAFVDDFIHLCGLKPIIKTPDPHTALSIPSNELPPEIEFDGVSFTYPGHTIPTIRDVSFKVQPGEKIAIVGEIGAGKTTLLKLLFRIYTPTEGRILVNGNDIGEISLESWYSSLGVMLQEFNHYFFSIRENIALGKPGNLTIDTDVIEAAQNAGVYAFVKNLPNGFDTITDRVFLGGTDLSKGQNQLLALSRLLYRGANIIVLDEPTSALDAISEEKAFEHLEQLKNTTMIFIAHRLSTVRQADTIYVLERGKIKEFGSHEELMMQNNSYAELYSTQAQYYQ
jgi:ABC-type multidrug transport system fused ATPase/permease subunit